MLNCNPTWHKWEYHSAFLICWQQKTAKSLNYKVVFLLVMGERVQLCSLFSVPRLRFFTGLCSPEELNVFSCSFIPCLPIKSCATIAVVRMVWMSELQFPCLAQQLDSRKSQRQAHLMKRPLEWMGDNSKDVAYNIKSKCCSVILLKILS